MLLLFYILQATENQILKKKMLEEIFPDLQTNSDGLATYKGVPLTTSVGACMAKGLSNAKIAWKVGNEIAAFL